MITIAEQKLSN